MVLLEASAHQPAKECLAKVSGTFVFLTCDAMDVPV